MCLDMPGEDKTTLVIPRAEFEALVAAALRSNWCLQFDGSTDRVDLEGLDAQSVKEMLAPLFAV